ncbi:hypothetical protein K402DRAFT_227850 [Aulographum hederae CBS 113979]|uniref:Uncharacterized protein n=1 Tax=Aulographum hederae CBS 113979 TaxID=1176131 RepID=A0A6G1HAX0_9PEZI|nr:hypothetical protein K402DRAFT_227850 [Aulographum hederae CBS 113979]
MRKLQYSILQWHPHANLMSENRQWCRREWSRCRIATRHSASPASTTPLRRSNVFHKWSCSQTFSSLHQMTCTTPVQTPDCVAASTTTVPLAVPACR